MNPDFPARPEPGPDRRARPEPGPDHPGLALEPGLAVPHPPPGSAVGVIGAGRAWHRDWRGPGPGRARGGSRSSAASEASVHRARAAFPAAVITEPSQGASCRADLAADRARRRPAGPGGRAGRHRSPDAGAHAGARQRPPRPGLLEPAARRGGLPLALHPVMMFTGRADDVDRLAGRAPESPRLRCCGRVRFPEPDLT